MRIKICRPRLLQCRDGTTSEHCIENAITNLQEAITKEHCSICKEWIDRILITAEENYDRVKYSHELYKLKKDKGIMKPWRELDATIKAELKKEVKNGKQNR